MSVQHVLMGVLAEGPAHGYDLKRAYDERFPGGKALAYGQVYAALSRLQQDGLVEVAETRQDGGPERTTYALTAEGRKALDAWLAETEPAGAYAAVAPGPQGHHRPAARRRRGRLPAPAAGRAPGPDA